METKKILDYEKTMRANFVYIPRGIKGLQTLKWEELYMDGFIEGYEKRYCHGFFFEATRFFARNFGLGYVHAYTEVAVSFAKQLKERGYPITMIMDVTKLTPKAIAAL